MKTVSRLVLAVLLVALVADSKADSIRGNLAADPSREVHQRHPMERDVTPSHGVTEESLPENPKTAGGLLQRLSFDHMSSSYPALVKSLKSIWGLPDEESPAMEQRN